MEMKRIPYSTRPTATAPGSRRHWSGAGLAIRFHGWLRIGALLGGIAVATGVSAQMPAPLSHPNLDLDGSVYVAVRQLEGGLVFGGSFTTVNGLARHRLARLRPDGQLDPDWNPGADDTVRALALGDDGAVYVGGWFTEIDGQPRSRIARLSATASGAVDPDWAPSISGNVVFALAVDGDAVYAGGDFSHVDEWQRSRIVKLSASGAGAVDPLWNPSASSYVYALAVDAQGMVYVGGNFTNIGGQPRGRIARLSGTGEGLADATWNPGADGWVRVLALDGQGALYVGGDFSSIGGQWRDGIARVRVLGPGQADVNWAPAADGWVAALALDGDGALYVGGAFTQLGGQPRDRVAKVSTRTMATVDPEWNPSAGEDGWVRALAIGHQGAIHVGGEFTHIGGQPRSRLAVLPASNRIFSQDFDCRPGLQGCTPLIVAIDNIGFVPNPNFIGGSVRWTDGFTCQCDGGASGDPDDLSLNVYGSTVPAFYWPNHANGLEGGVTLDGGGTYATLQPGALIGPSSQFLMLVAGPHTLPWRQPDGVDAYLGFRFLHQGIVKYGYARITTGPDNGRPVTIHSIRYNDVGDPIAIP